MSSFGRVARAYARSRGTRPVVTAVAAVVVLAVASPSRAASVSYAERHLPRKQPGVFRQALDDESAPPHPVVTPANAPATHDSSDDDDAATVASATGDDTSLASLWLGPDSRTPIPDEDLSTTAADETNAGVAIPIPPGVWTGLSGLAGLAVVYGWKNLRHHRRGSGRRPA